MTAAIGWGALAASAPLPGALINYHLSPGPGPLVVLRFAGSLALSAV